MCIGIDHCSKKNCLEQEKCLFPEAKTKKRVKINQCQLSKKFCNSERACDVLGQCMMDHQSVKASKKFKKELSKVRGIKQVLLVFEQYMPEKIKVKNKQNERNNRRTKNT
jgi:hypothetical protein